MAASVRKLLSAVGLPAWQHRAAAGVLRALSRSSSSPGSKPVLTLFTKQNEACSLCDVAKAVLAKYSTEFTYEEAYIDAADNEAWFEQYKYDIPVIHLNGAFLMKHKVDETLLKKTLENYKTAD